MQLAIKSTRERQVAEVADRHARDAFFGGVLEQRAQNRLVLRAVDARQHREKFGSAEMWRKVKLRQQFDGHIHPRGSERDQFLAQLLGPVEGDGQKRLVRAVFDRFGQDKVEYAAFRHGGALRFHLRERFAAQGVERARADGEATVECDGAMRHRKGRAAGFLEARFDLFRGDGAAARRLGHCAGDGHAVAVCVLGRQVHRLSGADGAF